MTSPSTVLSDIASVQQSATERAAALTASFDLYRAAAEAELAATIDRATRAESQVGEVTQELNNALSAASELRLQILDLQERIAQAEAALSGQQNS